MESAIRVQIKKVKRMRFNINKGDKYLKEVQKLQLLSQNCAEEDKDFVANELLLHVDKSLSDMKNFLIEYKNKKSAPIIQIDNQQYDMRNWATISQYAKIFGYKSVQALSNKISRGAIAQTDIVYIPALDIKLIRLP